MCCVRLKGDEKHQLVFELQVTVLHQCGQSVAIDHKFTTITSIFITKTQHTLKKDLKKKKGKIEKEADLREWERSEKQEPGEQKK